MSNPWKTEQELRRLEGEADAMKVLSSQHVDGLTASLAGIYIRDIERIINLYRDDKGIDRIEGAESAELAACTRAEFYAKVICPCGCEDPAPEITSGKEAGQFNVQCSICSKRYFLYTYIVEDPKATGQKEPEK